jgi:hypothetical protein
MRAAAAFVAGALALGGCASLTPPQTAALLAAPASGLPARAERAEVPFFPQTPHHCGPAALATVLSDAGLVATPDELSEALFLPSRQGTLQTEMLAAARQRGALAYLLPGELTALLREVAGGQPVVVLQNLGLAIAPLWHYAVLVGYDLERRQVVLRSGLTRRELMSLETFEHTWARSGHWAFVALPPGRLPEVVDETGATQAALAFERVATPDQAARAYATLLARWPQSLLGGIGLGNARMAGGDVDAAAEAFGRVGRQHDSAVAWNNLAQAQLRRGDFDAALEAAQRALLRARAGEPRWIEDVEQTLREVTQAASGPR